MFRLLDLINLVKTPENCIPKRKHNTDSGFDLRANLPDHTCAIIGPGKRALIPTGLYLNMPSALTKPPEGFILEAQVRSRSGLAYSKGLMVLNSPGSIDNSYTGEIKVILYNSDLMNACTINNGDRIAQLVFNLIPVITSPFDDEYTRGGAGFGSTGV